MSSNPPDKMPRLFGDEDEEDESSRLNDPFRPHSLFAEDEVEPMPIPLATPPDDTVERGSLVARLSASLETSRTAPQQFPDAKQLLDARRSAAQQSRLRATLKSHRVIGVVSEIGGSGKTTVALSLANTLALARSSSIVLFEADPMNSIIAPRLKRPAPASLQALLKASHTMTEQIDWMPHTEQLSSGLQILFAPDHPPLDQLLRGQDYIELMDQLCKHYEIVTIDAPTGFAAPAALSTLQAADQIIICARAASPDLRAAEASLEWIRSQGGKMMAETTILAITETVPGALSRLSKSDYAPNPKFFATCLIPYDEQLTDSKLTTKRLSDATLAAYQYLAMATTYAFPVVEEVDLAANPGWKDAQANDLTWVKE